MPSSGVWIKGIGGFPVVDEQRRLVGIITETQIARAMLQLFGTEDRNEIITLENVDLQPGTFGKIVTVVEKLGINILSMFSLPRRTTDLLRVYIRIKSGQREEAIRELTKAGYEIID